MRAGGRTWRKGTPSGSAAPSAVLYWTAKCWEIAPARACSYGIAIGLDSKSGTTKIRLRHRFDCTSFAGTLRASLLGSAGEVTPLTAGCSAAPVEEVATLPGTGKRYLWVEATAPANPPCSLPSPSTLPIWALTSYVLEP